MPDGTPKPDPNDPAYQDAYQRALEEGRKDNTGGGLFGIFETIADMATAAEAGAFAVRPDVAQEVVKQLTKIQDQVATMQTGLVGGVLDQRLGGGYATQIATFNSQVTGEGPGKLLKTFSEELEQLKSAVSRSIANYGQTDSGASRRVDRAGGGL
ncbi:hypothetical protein [Kibdelosporangium aridum]|uniref:hypothetical protein n=1 Tax=Kibdelosporangium aridum TaxID=2030 RepID=UPI00068FB4EC